MSVDYSCGVYNGFKVSEEEYDILREKFSEYDFDESCLVHLLNQWCGGDYFFGYCLVNCDGDGTAVPLPDEDIKTSKELINELNEIIKIIEKAGLPPRRINYHLVSMVY